MSAREDGSRSAAPARHHVALLDRQRKVAVRTDAIRRTARRVLAAARPEGGELSVVLVDDAAIASLNAEHRGKPTPTDVLSFSQLEGPSVPLLVSGGVARRQATVPPAVPGGAARAWPAPRGARGLSGGPAQLAPLTPTPARGLSGGVAQPPPLTPIGDVVISVETARRQARERGRPLDEEIGALLVHGVLHLLGYDHERSAAAARAMFAREREVAAAAGLPAEALGDRPRRPARPGSGRRPGPRAGGPPPRRTQGGQA